MSTAMHLGLEPLSRDSRRSRVATDFFRAAWSGFTSRLRVHFPRGETHGHALDYLRGLLSDVERKNSWQLAEAVGDRTPDALQHLLNRAAWDADVVRDDLRGYVVDSLGDAQHAALIVDETGFLKKGTHSVGVQRQHSGTAGRIENCQVGVFLAYNAPRGWAFLDRALYMPASWTNDRARCAAAGVPDDVTFATKPQLAQTMLLRAFDAGVKAAWVLGDEVYSDWKLRRWLGERRQPFVLAVTCQHHVFYEGGREWVRDIATDLPRDAWHRLSAGAGAKGPRWYDWAFLRFPEAGAPRGMQRGILFRRSRSDRHEVAYYEVLAPQQATLQDLALAAGMRWAIEVGFESSKGEVGLDQYEVRSWKGWHRHITLALFAHAFLTVQRARARPDGEKSPQPARSSRSL